MNHTCSPHERLFMFNQKQKPLALDILQLGFVGVVSSTNNPEGACVIRNFNGHHHDVYIKKGSILGHKGEFRIRFYDTLIGQTVSFDTVESLQDVKQLLDNV